MPRKCSSFVFKMDHHLAIAFPSKKKHILPTHSVVVVVEDVVEDGVEDGVVVSTSLCHSSIIRSMPNVATTVHPIKKRHNKNISKTNSPSSSSSRDMAAKVNK